MKKEQAHAILYTFWENGYLQSNFTEGHSEYYYAIQLLMNFKKEQAHAILYTFWENGYLQSNFTQEHSEYYYAIQLLMNFKKA